MPGDALIWLLAGVGIGIALSMLILAVVAMSDRRQIGRTAVTAEVTAPLADVAAAAVKPVIAKAVVPASAMVAPVAANTVAPKPAPVPAPAPARAPAAAEMATVASAEPVKARPRDMSVEALFAEAFGASELPKAAEPGTAK